MDFKDKIEQQLKGLDRKQICQFAWLCGVRALPFLSVQRGFAYWPKNDRQKHLYSIFNALDVCAKAPFLNDFTNGSSAIYVSQVYDAHSTDDARIVARAVADAAFRALNVFNTTIRAYTEGLAYSDYYASEASDTYISFGYADESMADTIYNSYVSEARTSAACTATHTANAAVACANTITHAKNIENILFKDIEAIENNRLDECEYDTAMYGELWGNFQEDLKNIGCAYWAQLYEDLFKNGFDKLDKEELKHRISVPESIRSLGAVDVGFYLSGLHKNFYEARIIILGEKGAGKTSLAKKLLNPEVELSPTEESTEGVEIYPWELQETNGVEAMTAHIWDFAGHVITHTAHRYFLAERCIYIIVYDGRTENRNDLKKWLKYIKYYGKDSPVYILVNLHDKYIPRIDKNMLLDKFTNINEFVELSLLDDTDKVKEFRNKLENLIRSNPILLNAEWYKVKETIEKRFKDKDLININEFNNIAQEVGIKKEDADIMKRIFDVLGICLWYNEIPNLHNLVLNPGWITDGIYKIMNWLDRNNKYDLYISNFDEIFCDQKDAERYLSLEKRTFLFELLTSDKYKLAYPIKEAENSKNPGLVLPSMLLDQPKTGMKKDYIAGECLLMRYRVNSVMPIGILAQFIVSHHKIIKRENDKELVWRYGVVLEDKEGGNEALVIEDDMEIILRVKGRSEDEFLKTLQGTFNSIFDKYKNEKGERDYELEYAIYNAIKKPIFVSDEAIKEFVRGDIMDELKRLGGINVNGNNNTIVSHSPGAKVNSGNIKLNLPKDVTEERFTKVLNELESFLNSDQAGKMEYKDVKAMQAGLSKAKELNQKKGLKMAWEHLRGYLSDAANIAAIGTAIAGILSKIF